MKKKKGNPKHILKTFKKKKTKEKNPILIF